MSKGSAGGLVMAMRQREHAIAKYYQNPNRCLLCKSVIEVGDKKVSAVRRNKFCNQSCAATYHNPSRKKPTIPKIKKEKRESKNGTKLKSEVDKRSIYYHAKIVLKNDPKKCAVCGYDKFVDMCHVIPVRSFDKTTLISEINSKKNLIYLCPNCHHELDGGLLDILEVPLPAPIS